MKSTPITIYTGLSYIDEEYIDIETSGVALDLSSYDLQMQILDVDDSYNRLLTATVTKDAGTTGRCWPTLTAAQSTSLTGKTAVWVLLFRPSDQSKEPRLIAYGRVNVRQGATWQ